MANDPTKPDYRPSPDPTLPRTPGTWIMLLMVWTLGLGVWALYLALIGYLVVTVFS